MTITAQLADAHGVVVPTAGQVVAWSSTNGGSFSSPTSTTNASGAATVVFTVSTVANTSHVIRATTGSIIGSISLSTEAGPATALVFIQQPTSFVAGSIMAPVKLEVRDQFGNVVINFATPISVGLGTVATPNAHLSGGEAQTPVYGVVTFSNLSIDLVGSGYRLSAAAPPLTAASTSFNVTGTQPPPSIELGSAGASASDTATQIGPAGRRATRQQQY